MKRNMIRATNELDDWDLQETNDPARGSGNSVDLLQVALRRKGLLVVGLFLGLCLGVLFFLRATPIYQSVAQLLIAKKAVLQQGALEQQQQRNPNPGGDHAFILKSEFLLNQVLQKQDIKELDIIKHSEHPLQDVYDGLEVTPLEAGSEIIEIRFRAENALECQDILRCILDSYIGFLNKDQKSKGAEYLDFFKKQYDKISHDLEEKEAEYATWKEGARLQFNQNEARNIHQDRQVAIEKARFDAVMRNNMTATRIDQIESAMALEVDVESLYMMAANEDPGFVAVAGFQNQEEQFQMAEDKAAMEREMEIRSRLFPLFLRDKQLQHKYGPKHPLRRAVQLEIQMAKEFDPRPIEEGFDGELTELDEKPTEERLREHILTYLEYLRNKLTAGKKEVEAYDNDYAKEQQAAETIAKDFYRNQRYENEIARLSDERQAMLKQLSAFNMAEEFGGDERYRIQPLQEPGIGLQVEPSLAKTLLAGSVLGLLAGFGLAYIVEASDKTFKSPQEIGQTLKLPIVGHIPEIEADEPVAGSNLAPVLIAAHKPKSPLSENFRAIRTALYFSGGREHRVIQTTSPVPGDGKSTLTANLAVSIAQSSKRVLLLDADFRRPTQHKLFGLKVDVGLASVVDGKADPSEAVQQTSVPNLSVMACGPRPHNPAELLTSPEFEELLKVLREQYDFVLVDTPPLLAVTDPSVVAARVDGVLLALRIRKNGRPNAERACKILHDVKANLMGVVVNGLDGKTGSYGYYSNYRKGYGYGYSYSYKYGYGQESDQAIDKYFDEEKQLTAAKS